jgi:hypothetical protein
MKSVVTWIQRPLVEDNLDAVLSLKPFSEIIDPLLMLQTVP